MKKIIKASKKLKRKIIPMNMTLMLYMFMSSVFFLNVYYNKPEQLQNVTESN